MKKLASILAVAIMSLSSVIAQTPVTAKTKLPVKNAQVAKKVEVKKSEVKVVKAQPASAAITGPTKKDGTADMRYKANKTGKVVGPTKKDGTADMRYKVNKPVKKAKQ